MNRAGKFFAAGVCSVLFITAADAVPPEPDKSGENVRHVSPVKPLSGTNPGGSAGQLTGNARRATAVRPPEKPQSVVHRHAPPPVVINRCAPATEVIVFSNTPEAKVIFYRTATGPKVHGPPPPPPRPRRPPPFRNQHRHR